MHRKESTPLATLWGRRTSADWMVHTSIDALLRCIPDICKGIVRPLRNDPSHGSMAVLFQNCVVEVKEVISCGCGYGCTTLPRHPNMR